MTVGGDAPAPPDDDVFVTQRPRLVGVAYRMLGTVDDADDVVQEAWLRWRRADRAAIERPEAWLTTVTTRLALDRLRSARRRRLREGYVGPWLPEPVVAGPGPDDVAELADSLSLGFLTLLDRLQPLERAVFLLADVFAVPYAEIAATVDRSEVACRQIASRARRRLRDAPAVPPRPADRAVVDELLVCLATGDVAGVLARLAPDTVLLSDGGPTRRAARRPVVGAWRVARLMTNLARREFAGAEVAPATVNGDPGIVLRLDGRLDMVVAFQVRDGLVSAVWTVRNPDKLRRVGASADTPVCIR